MNKSIYHIAKLIAGLVLIFNVISLLWVVIYAIIPIPITKLMVMEGAHKDIHYEWVALEEMDDQVELAVMCAEDQFFLLHDGLDFQSIDKAIESNREGRKTRGASTLSQQVAKNVFLWPSRDWIRKGAEVYYTLLIEMVWSKQRIMEVYLNVAEMGDGIFGVEAASQRYFRKPASDLTTQQAALLAAVLPSPKRYSIQNPGPYMTRRTDWIMKQMNYWGNTMTYDPEFVEEMLK